MSRIPQAFLSDLVARTDLLELIGARVSLKRAGSNYKGLCPFHDEKTPSFTVSPDKGFYKCFGCGAYGNAIDFVMDYENRGFLEAVEILADLLHLEIPVEGHAADRKDELAPLYDVLREADQIYRQALREDQAAIAYLKQRGIDGATAGRFGLGFAPDAWDTLIKALGASAAGVERLLKAGLAARNEQGRTYDRFRNRIMFPIRDGRGRVIGFGGRLMGAGEPKYLNSPDTPLFDKGRTLYGLYEMRGTPGRPSRIVIVEGFVDVIALTQHGLGPAIATMGTAATSENMRQATRLSDRVVFCFDGDRAGRDAAWRAVESVLPFGGGKVAIEFVLLPDGEDPDSFVHSLGKEAFETLLAGATPLSTFMLNEAARGLELDNADGRARLVTAVQPLLERLPAGHYRELLIDQLAASLAMQREHVERQLARASKPPEPPRPRKSEASGKSTIRRIMTFVLHFPGAVAGAADIEGLDEIDAPGGDLLRRMLDIARQDPGITLGQFIEQFPADPERTWVRQLAAADPMPFDGPDGAPQLLRDSLEMLVERHRRAERVGALRQRQDGTSMP